jgi:hypothetical protein
MNEMHIPSFLAKSFTKGHSDSAVMGEATKPLNASIPRRQCADEIQSTNSRKAFPR